MDTKICSSCGPKPIENFGIKRTVKGEIKLQSKCRDCNKKYQRGHYLRNKSDYYAKSKRYFKTYKNDIVQQIILYFKEHPCLDCGEDDPIVLEFDHRDPKEKKNNIPRLISNGNSWKTILIEIGKCDVRCANCHRRRTAKQFNWLKLAHSSSG